MFLKRFYLISILSPIYSVQPTLHKTNNFKTGNHYGLLNFELCFANVFEIQNEMKSTIIVVISIIFINFLVYYKSLDGEFVFDDTVAILKNNDIKSRNISIQEIKVLCFSIYISSLNSLHFCSIENIQE